MSLAPTRCPGLRVLPVIFTLNHLLPPGGPSRLCSLGVAPKGGPGRRGMPAPGVTGS